MNYKLLFPTYRNRYRFIQQNLERFKKEGRRFQQGLNLGTGEGDYDQMIASYCKELAACDINPADVAFAKQLNHHVSNLSYRVENALELTFSDHQFDLITSVDVIEHVGQPERMVEEVARVLAPGGMALITFPSQEFPFTYDPINRLLSFFGNKTIAQGAYAFGHEYLVLGKEFRYWAEKYGLSIVDEVNLSGYLVALMEMYWTGIVQRMFKANATNLADSREKVTVLRPSAKAPWLVFLTDMIINIDKMLFGRMKSSVGKGFVITKK
jgi:2-polyprenyl-3-methyl-5-hydroxy-6-metoxy-1,4-benzoquinol methylase